MANIYNMIDTWNDGATTFTSIKMNVTDTASASASLLMDLQVGGTSQFSITKAGKVTSGYGTSTSPAYGFGDGTGIGGESGQNRLWFFRSGTRVGVFDGNGFAIAASRFGFGVSAVNAVSDTYIFRDAANTIAFRNSTNAQTFNIYNTYTSGSVYERGFLRWNSNTFQIGMEQTGGTNRNVEIYAAGAVALRADTAGNLVGGSFASADSGLFDVYSSKGAALATTTASAKIRLRASTSGGDPYISISSDGYFGFASGTSAITNAPDTGFKRSAAGVIVVTDASTGGASLEFREQTAPSAPSTNNVRIYAQDNGAGKTQLMALFATGAAQQIAIEP